MFLTNIGLRTSTPILLTTLLSLLHPTAPKWLTQHISSALAAIPTTRPHGVRHILQLFLASSETAQPGGSISIDALAKASRLLGSVPSTTLPAMYFQSVGEQLIDLLHGNDENLGRAAAYVIADLLDKRGRSEEAIHQYVCAPILSSLLQSSSIQSKRPLAVSRSTLVSIIDEEGEEDQLPATLVPEASLYQSLHALAKISTAHPTLSTPEKLLTPVVPHLWGIYIYAKQSKKAGDWLETSKSLILGWLRYAISLSNETGIRRFLEFLTFPGEEAWQFATGDGGGIEIRSRSGSDSFGFDNIEFRAREYLGFLEQIGDGAITSTFLIVFREWIRREKLGAGRHEDSVEDADLQKALGTLQLLQLLLSEYTDSLARSPSEVLQVVKEVLDGYVSRCQLARQRSSSIGLPSLASLGQIVQEEIPSRTNQQDLDDDEIEDTAENIVLLTISLLNAVISSPDTKLTDSDERLLKTIEVPLRFITENDDSSDLANIAFNILSIISTTVVSSSTSKAIDAISRDREVYKTALTYLTDALVPVRAHGLSILRQLIHSRSPIIDVQKTLQLLVSMLADADSFVYLNVVKSLQAMGDVHPRLTIRELFHVYTDEQQKLSLDERLRIGEALVGIIQRQGQAFVEESARLIGEGMIDLISRRRTRADKPTKSTRKAKPSNADEEGMDLEQDLPDVDEDGNPLSSRQLEELEYKRRIVEGWKPTNAEDYRLRTSALSILSVAVETNSRGIGQRVINDAVETSISILQLEQGPEAGILRRAAMVLLAEAVKSGMANSRAADIKRTVGWICSVDNDGMVREMGNGVETLLNEKFGAVVLESPIPASRTAMEGVGGIERLALK